MILEREFNWAFRKCPCPLSHTLSPNPLPGDERRAWGEDGGIFRIFHKGFPRPSPQPNKS